MNVLYCWYGGGIIVVLVGDGEGRQINGISV